MWVCRTAESACTCPYLHAFIGRSKGTVAVTPAGAIKLEYNWGAPLGGTGIDEFSIDDQGRLRLCTIATVGDDSVEYCQIYNRKR